MIDRNRLPSRRELHVFGAVMPAALGLIGAMVKLRGGPPAAFVSLWAMGALAAVVYFAVPAVRWPAYRAWMTALYPIGWVVSHAALAVTYFLVITPIGRFVRRGDPLRRRRDPQAGSYWTARTQRRDLESYFRQF